MDESAVFGHVIDELETRDYQPLVHVPGAHEDTYADVLDRCETHQITIGGGIRMCWGSRMLTECLLLR